MAYDILLTFSGNHGCISISLWDTDDVIFGLKDNSGGQTAMLNDGFDMCRVSY